METNAPKIEWRYDGNFAFGSYPINDDYRAEYMFYDHDFGYGLASVVSVSLSSQTKI